MKPATSKPKSGLKLDGKEFSLEPKSPTADKIIAFLDSAPKDQIYSKDGISFKVGVSRNSPDQLARKGFLDGYSLTIGKFRYYGNQAAIKSLVQYTLEKEQL